MGYCKQADEQQKFPSFQGPLKRNQIRISKNALHYVVEDDVSFQKSHGFLKSIQ
jgi:hypothetical protein